jgi:hypothetical protein
MTVSVPENDPKAPAARSPGCTVPIPDTMIGFAVVLRTVNAPAVLGRASTVERFIRQILWKVEAVACHLGDPVPDVSTVPEGDMNNTMVIGLEELPGMIWDYIQILSNRPAEDGRRKEEGE